MKTSLFDMEDSMPGEHNPNIDFDNLHLTAEEAAARAASVRDEETGANTEDIKRASMALKDAAVTLGDSLKETLAVTNAYLTRAVREKPLTTLGGAAGAGFVLGGGLSAPLTRSMVRVGLKAGTAFFLDAAIKTLTAVQDTTRDSRRATSSEDTLSDTSINTGETP